MADLIRESALGFTLRTLTRGKLFGYAEDRPDFQLPDSYVALAQGRTPERSKTEGGVVRKATTDQEHHRQETKATEEKIENEGATEPAQVLSRATTASSTTTSSSGRNGEGGEPIEKVKTQDRHLNLHKVETTRDLERAVTAATAKRTATRPIIPTKTAEGVILVDWYTTDDVSNPQNWSFGKKGLVMALICSYTMAVYMGSSIYTSSEPALIEIFGISQTVASLGLALYVLGYGIGPLLFSPLSEIPIIGRNVPYISSFFVFVLLFIPAGLVNNVPGLLVLRFLQGFFGSPCLATAGATIQDMYNILELPYMMTIWVAAATLGPSLGPLISGFSVPALDWHWSMWEILLLSGPVWAFLFVALPETSGPNILLRRAQRLRKLTGNSNFKSQSELDQAKLTASQIVKENLYHPLEISIKDPSLAFVQLYSSFCYAIYYSFFEFFPAVFIGFHGFNLGQLGLAFLCITVSIIIAIASYFAYLFFYVNPRIVANGLGPPEARLVPALGLSILVPVGLFIYGWTSAPDLPWVAPLVGVGIYNLSIFLIFQCIFLYVPFSYPQYAASLFAANDFARSSLSFASILFASPMVDNLGVSRGVTVLAGISIIGIPGIWILWYFGPALRARSKFTVKA